MLVVLHLLICMVVVTHHLMFASHSDIPSNYKREHTNYYTIYCTIVIYWPSDTEN